MIWYNENITLEAINLMSKNTLAEHLKIQFTEIGEDYLKATMPVDATTHQPFGLLHGGASAALAETIGSVASWMCINPEKQACVGIEINCNHVRGKKEGMVTAISRPIHIGGSTQVWEIRITEENEKLVCISRLTMAVIKKL